jgi:hypothetical protein
MSLAGITQHCKIMYSEWPGPGWVQQATITVLSVSLRKPGAVGLGFSQSHLLRTNFRIALTQLAGSAFDDSISEHSYHRHEEEVTGVHEMQIA